MVEPRPLECRVLFEWPLTIKVPLLNRLVAAPFGRCVVPSGAVTVVGGFPRLFQNGQEKLLKVSSFKKSNQTRS